MRIFLSLLCLASIFLTPWWFTLLLMLGTSLRYRAEEIMFYGLLMDFIWIPLGFTHIPMFTIAAIVIVWVLEPLREQLFV